MRTFTPQEETLEEAQDDQTREVPKATKPDSPWKIGLLSLISASSA